MKVQFPLLLCSLETRLGMRLGTSDLAEYQLTCDGDEYVVGGGGSSVWVAGYTSIPPSVIVANT